MKKHLQVVCLFWLFIFPPLSAWGQSLDSIRQVAWDGQYQKAREMAMERNDYPENGDLLFLVGQTYLWDGNLGLAKERFLEVLEKSPQHLEAITGLTSIHVREGEYSEALTRAEDGLKMDNKKEDLLYYKAFALVELGRLNEARKQLDTLLSFNPNHKEALELKESMNSFKIPGAVGIYQSVQWYDDPHERRFYTTTVEAPIGDKNVKIIPRFNFGALQMDGNETTGSQAGLDVYPLTGPDSYLYLHYAYSDSEIFPMHRGAVEWFKGARTGWELSAGGRYLFWEDHQYFFSASASKYLGQWLPGLRLFYAPESDNDLAALMSLRRYLNDANNYVQVYLGYGPNPDRTERQIDFIETSKTTRYTGGIYSIFNITGPFYFRILGEYNYEEYVSGQWRDAFLVQAGIEYKF